MTYKNLEERKRLVIEYIKNNPRATYNQIRKDTLIHPERIFKGGMAEIFKVAGLEAPRDFKFKSLEERKKLIIDLIKNNPKISSFQIKNQLKINVPSTFKSIKEAYKEAGVEYPREKSYNKTSDEKRREILRLIKNNPEMTLQELEKITKIKSMYRLFKNFKDAYEKAGVKRITNGEKTRKKKIKEVIVYIKNNPLATQREINRFCKTKVQSIFDKGIFEAYERAGIKYPFERKYLHGTALKEIKKRARNFEDEIALILSGYGKVNQLVKTKRGVADIILERKDKKIVIEVKDYQLKEISIPQIEQLNKYLEDLNSDIGILICHKKPKKDRFLIGKNRIFVLEKQELNRIPEIV